jgi:toxic protein SymE
MPRYLNSHFYFSNITLVMAEHDFISESVMSKAQRQYIIGYVPNQGDTSTLNIHLKGKWLREAGFETGECLCENN